MQIENGSFEICDFQFAVAPPRSIVFRYNSTYSFALRAHEDAGGLTRLARGLAALACRPGGVTHLGVTWVAVAVPETGQAAA